MNDTYYYNATDVNDKGEVILQGDMHTADDLGLIKADFLGLRTVDVIYDTLEMIDKDYEYIAPHNLNFKDDKVYENFRNGFTAGVFQFESTGMQDTLKKIESGCIEDLIVANALFRPSSIKFIDNYADRKKGLEEFSYLHPDLEPILKDTYGIMVFQEQLIEIGRLAKLSNPDELRKATAKKKPALLAKIQPELFKGLSNRGWTETQLNELWDMMLDFAKYSFNKSHAAAYAIVAYICMYLKTYHPKEFLCAWINSVSNKTEKVAECVAEAQRLGVKVYQGKYNDCSAITRIYKDGIMMGTQTIKYCNKEIADNLMALPKCNSFIELLDNIDIAIIDIKKLTILTGLNFFSEFGKNKKLIKTIQLYYGVKKKINGSKSPKTILPSIRECSQLSKDKLEIYYEYGITEYLVKKYSNKETAKLYKEIDNVGLLNAIVDRLPNEPMPLIEYLKFQKEYLQYVVYSNNDINKDYYIVVDFVVGKDIAKPRLLLHNLKTGKETKTRIKQSRIYKENPFGEYDILSIQGFTWDYKRKYVNNNWITTNELEPILEEYEVI